MDWPSLPAYSLLDSPHMITCDDSFSVGKDRRTSHETYHVRVVAVCFTKRVTALVNKQYYK